MPILPPPFDLSKSVGTCENMPIAKSTMVKTNVQMNVVNQGGKGTPLRVYKAPNVAAEDGLGCIPSKDSPEHSTVVLRKIITHD